MSVIKKEVDLVFLVKKCSELMWIDLFEMYG